MVQGCKVNHQHKEYASTIRNVPKGSSKISGTQTIDSDWKSLKCWLPKEAPKKRALVTSWHTHWNWSKGSGNGCGAEQSCAAIIQRNSLPWANCSMVEVVFEKWKNRRARLHAQLHWEVHASPLKTTSGASRRRSLCSYTRINKYDLWLCMLVTAANISTVYHVYNGCTGPGMYTISWCAFIIYIYIYTRILYIF